MHEVEFESFEDSDGEYGYVMSPESNTEQPETTAVTVQQVGLCSELVETVNE